MIGILGGTFDPPHNGHVALARAAREQLPIDELVILVEQSPGHRGVIADADTRLQMARAAFVGEDVRLDPNAFTVDTVRGGPFEKDALFILGADQAAMFSRWREPDEVLKWVKLAIGTRGGYDMPDLSRTATGSCRSSWPRPRSRRARYARACTKASRSTTSSRRRSRG